MTAGERRLLWVVLGAAALADALLAPFYPRFFEQTFAADAVLTPGLYVGLSRLAVAVALPAWTHLAKRRPRLRTILAAQIMAGIAGAASAFAPNLPAFLVLALLTDGLRATYLLLYPLLISDAPPEARGRVVAAGAALVNATALIAAVLGGLLLDAFGGRLVIAVGAAVDFALLLPLGWLARRRAAALPSEPAAEGAASNDPAEVSSSWWAFAGVGFLATFAFVLLRPHFSLFVEHSLRADLPTYKLGLLFAVPSVAAVAAMPLLAPLLTRERAHRWLVAGSLLLAATAFWQWMAGGWTSLVIARALHGVSLYAVEISLEYAALATCGDAFARFGWVSSLQSAAVVLAPLTASALCTIGFGPLFFAATAVAATGAALAIWAASPRRLAAAPAGGSS